jgi:hypothetical protein
VTEEGEGRSGLITSILAFLDEFNVHVAISFAHFVEGDTTEVEGLDLVNVHAVHGCIISYSGDGVKGNSDFFRRILDEPLDVFHGIIHGIPILVQSSDHALVEAGAVHDVLDLSGEGLEGDVDLEVAVVHGYIIPQGWADVKGKSENIFVTALGAVAHVAVRMPFLLAPTLVAGGEFAKVQGLIVLVHVLHYPYYRHDVNRTGGKNPILSRCG